MDLIATITPGTLFFYLLASVVVLSALGVALAPNLLYSAFALLGTLGGVAGLYMFLGADFVGIVQLLIYIGGILVLILFAVLLTNRIGEVKLSNPSAGIMLGAPAAVGMLALIAKATLGTPWPLTEEAAAPTTARLGDAFLREQLLPFELASLILLMALVGSMVIARRAAKEEGKIASDGTHDRLAG
ncbi:MAG: NADH-quinone oxidoreductase subunit J [Myxococcales bacterium]|nr:NADH-quinone oxidoreductase subunit J [Myxococcales bacterium]